MNRVLEIDEELAYAVVEPGVRWFDLYDAIQAGGHKLMVSIADLGWGSVVGNFLDNGITYLPHGAGHGRLRAGWRSCSRTASVLRTGMGAMPDNRSWHVYKRGLGPTLDQLFMQSNFGIVTKMGVWLMPWPECYMPLWLRVWNGRRPRRRSSTRCARLMLDRTIENVPQIWNTISMASVISSRAPWYQGEDPIPDDVIDHMAPRARDRPLADALRALRRRGSRRPPLPQGEGGLRADPGRRGLGREARARRTWTGLEHPFDRVQAGVPNLDINQMTGWYGGEEGGHIGFSPVARLTGAGRARDSGTSSAAWSRTRRGSTTRPC